MSGFDHIMLIIKTCCFSCVLCIKHATITGTN